MNIALISPYPQITAFGLRIISAYLKKAGHKTKLILMPKNFMDRYGKEDLDAMIELSANSDLICISLSTNFFERAIQITERLKDTYKTPIIWGGIHPTLRPEECLEYADFICRGEGEEVIVELAEKIEKGQNWHDIKIKNVGFKDKNGNIALNPLRPLIEDLDSIPFADYDFTNQYLIREGKTYKMSEVSEEFLEKIWDRYQATGTFYIAHVSRGCPFGCTYCCNNALNKLYAGQKIFRKRSIDNVIEELKIIKDKLPFLSNIMISDDNFLGLPLEYIKEFSEKYKKYIKFPLVVLGVHPTNVSREKIYCLAEAGLTGLPMGFQTASERIKKLYKRNYPNSQIEKAVKIINEFRDKIKYIMLDLIIDNPWETEKDIIETLMFLTKLPVPYGLNIFSIVVFPGTELYDLAKKDGLIIDESREIYKKSFYDYPQKHLYSLFFLLSKYTSVGRRIHPAIMFLLTNKALRELRLSRLLFLVLDNYIEGGWIAQMVASRKKIKYLNIFHR